MNRKYCCNFVSYRKVPENIGKYSETTQLESFHEKNRMSPTICHNIFSGDQFICLKMKNEELRDEKLWN